MSHSRIQRIDKNNVKSFIDSTKTFIFDCDGVLWHSGDLLPKTNEFLDLLRGLVIFRRVILYDEGQENFLRDEQQHQFEKELFGQDGEAWDQREEGNPSYRPLNRIGRDLLLLLRCIFIPQTS